MLLAADLAWRGRVTGGGTQSEAGRDVERRVRPPYSVRVGDGWYAYNRLDPAGFLLGFSADMAETLALADGADDAAERVIAGTIVALRDNLASKTWMMGAAELLSVLDTPDAMGTAKLAKWLQGQTASAVVPVSSLVRNVAASADPVVRDARTVQGYLDGQVAELKRRIPGLSDTLPPRVGVWGEDVVRTTPFDNGALSLGFNFVSPMAYRAASDDPVDRAIVEGQIPISAPRRVQLGVELSADQYYAFAKRAGKLAHSSLRKVVGRAEWERLGPGPDGGRAALVSQVMRASRQAAMAEMMREDLLLRASVQDAQNERVAALMSQ